jgi:hypothetical protein
MILVSTTGLLLAWKKKADWLQPPTQKGASLESASQISSLDKIASAVFAKGIPELKSLDDIDRFELHTGKGVFKITSKTGYHEVQVHAGTAEVLSVSKRNDQMVEDIHDLSFFNEGFRETVLPVVALCLITLGISGIIMFFTPIYRRWQFNRTKGADLKSKSAAVKSEG